MGLGQSDQSPGSAAMPGRSAKSSSGGGTGRHEGRRVRGGVTGAVPGRRHLWKEPPLLQATGESLSSTSETDHTPCK